MAESAQKQNKLLYSYGNYYKICQSTKTKRNISWSFHCIQRVRKTVWKNLKKKKEIKRKNNCSVYLSFGISWSRTSLYRSWRGKMIVNRWVIGASDLVWTERNMQKRCSWKRVAISRSSGEIGRSTDAYSWSWGTNMITALRIVSGVSCSRIQKHNSNQTLHCGHSLRRETRWQFKLKN